MIKQTLDNNNYDRHVFHFENPEYMKLEKVKVKTLWKSRDWKEKEDTDALSAH